MKTYKIAVVNGDGIGHEIVPLAEQVLQAAAAKHGVGIQSTRLPFGAGYFMEHSDFISPDGLEVLQRYDAILFGAVGLPAVDDRLPFKLFTDHS